MIAGHDDSGGNEHAPVAIESQKRKGAEHVKMRFEPAAGQVVGDRDVLGQAQRIPVRQGEAQLPVPEARVTVQTVTVPDLTVTLPPGVPPGEVTATDTRPACSWP